MVTRHFSIADCGLRIADLGRQGVGGQKTEIRVRRSEGY